VVDGNNIVFFLDETFDGGLANLSASHNDNFHKFVLLEG
jgi:hypothetical protein